MADIKITDEMRDVLKRSDIKPHSKGGHALKLPNQLDRKLYVQVNAIIEQAGGKWNKGAQAHLFQTDPNVIFHLADAPVLVDHKKRRQAFFTPQPIAARLVEIARVSGRTVLEPSAGDGALVRECFSQGCKDVTAVELDPVDAAKIKAVADIPVIIGDFLAISPTYLYDRIVMNPPFTKGQGYRHVLHAVNFMKPTGRLVSILPGLSSGSAWDKFHDSLKERYDVTWEAIPAGAFNESGTGVNTLILVVSPRATEKE